MDAPVTTSDTLHEAIIAALRAQFGATVKQYGAYEPRDVFGTPQGTLSSSALLLQVSGGQVADLTDPDPFGRFALRFACQVYYIRSCADAENLQQALVAGAVEVARLVMPPLTQDQSRRGNDWGLGGAVELPENLGWQRVGASPELNGRDAVVVTWDQIVYL